MSNYELWRPDAKPSQISAYWSEQSDRWKTHEPIGPESTTAVKKFLGGALAKYTGQSAFLDLCSGADFTAYYPQNISPAQVSAMDISEEMLKTNPAIVKQVGDVRDNIPFPDETFDAITILFGWSHLYYNPYELITYEMKSDALRLYMHVLSEIKKKLKSGGHLVIVDIASQYMEATGNRYFNHKDIASLAHLVGFDNVEGGNIYCKEMFDGVLFSYVTQIDFLTCEKPN